MEQKEQNILFVAVKESYLLLSLKERLEKEGYTVTMAKAAVDDIGGVKETVSGVLIYTDEDLLKKDQALVYLKDKIAEDDIPLFIIGSQEELTAVEDYLPQRLFTGQFVRPINVNKVSEAIDAVMREKRSVVKKKILVVDDSSVMLRNVKSWLGDRYHVTMANSGAMAIKYLAMHQPDLILLDYEMPVVDGRQVLEMIRSEPDFRDIPVIFLTGKDDQESVMKVMALRPDGYLLKTMPPASIVKSVDDFFEKRKERNKLIVGE